VTGNLSAMVDACKLTVYANLPTGCPYCNVAVCVCSCMQVQ